MYYASLKAGAEVGLYIATHIPSIWTLATIPNFLKMFFVPLLCFWRKLSDITYKTDYD
jgi:hypothetical protein